MFVIRLAVGLLLATHALAAELPATTSAVAEIGFEPGSTMDGDNEGSESTSADEDDLALPKGTLSVRAKNTEGRRLFDEQRYAEAFPYLLDAGQYGFKRAQYRLYQIYAEGLGGVERDVEASIGWLGSAATPPTYASISKRFRKVRRQHKDHREWFNQIVEDYRALYGPEAKGVRCERTRVEGIRSEVQCFYKVMGVDEDLPSDLGPSLSEEYLRERQQEIPFCYECFDLNP